MAVFRNPRELGKSFDGESAKATFLGPDNCTQIAAHLLHHLLSTTTFLFKLTKIKYMCLLQNFFFVLRWHYGIGKKWMFPRSDHSDPFVIMLMRRE